LIESLLVHLQGLVLRIVSHQHGAIPVRRWRVGLDPGIHSAGLAGYILVDSLKKSGP
jgi:hypothetical protein